MRKNLLALFIALVIVLLVGEVVARALRLPPEINAEGRVTRRVEVEWSEHTNERGWHDVDHAVERSPGVTRLLVLGDSYVAARHVPLDSTFYRRLERRLNEGRAERAFEVIAIGRSGWNQRSELEAFLSEGASFEPDIVILCFLGFNDVAGNLPELHKSVFQQKRIVEKRPNLSRAPLSSFHGLIVPSSRLNRYISYQLSILYAKYEYVFDRSVSKESTIPIDYFVFAPDADPIWRNAWAATESLLVCLDLEVKRAGGRLLIVSLTMPQSYYEGGERDLERAFPALRGMGLDLTRPDSLLRTIVERREIPLLVLGPPFRERFARTRDPLHFRFNGHWNNAGHIAAAEEISEYLERNGWPASSVESSQAGHAALAE